MTLDTLLQAIRAFLIAACELTARPDDSVVFADAAADRPPLPYLTVKVIADGVEVEGPFLEVVDDGLGGEVERSSTLQRATISVQGYGRDTFVWLQMARARMSSELFADLADPIELVAMSPVLDVSDLIDTQIERRFSCDLTVAYCATFDAVDPDGDPLAAETGIVESTLVSHPSPDFVFDSTHDLTGAS